MLSLVNYRNWFCNLFAFIQVFHFILFICNSDSLFCSFTCKSISCMCVIHYFTYPYYSFLSSPYFYHFSEKGVNGREGEGVEGGERKNEDRERLRGGEGEEERRRRTSRVKVRWKEGGGEKEKEKRKRG